MSHFKVSIYRTTTSAPLMACESHKKGYFKSLDKRIKNINTAHEKAFDFVSSLKDSGDNSVVGFKIYYIDEQGQHCEQLNKLANTQDIYFI